MAYEVISKQSARIDTEDDVVVVRRTVRSLAQKLGFDAFATAAVTTATSELTRNVWVHARKGFAEIEEIRDGDRKGIRAVFTDEGPGIADVDRVLQGGYSTARSLGLGLSGSRRLVDELTIDTELGRGTTVTFLKWARY